MTQAGPCGANNSARANAESACAITEWRRPATQPKRPQNELSNRYVRKRGRSQRRSESARMVVGTRKEYRSRAVTRKNGSSTCRL